MTREEIPALSVLMVADVEPKPQTETTALTSHLEKRAEHKMTDTLELAHSPDPLEDNDDRGDVEPPTSTPPNPMLKGIYHCTHCDNIEAKEREVICWKCGKGEMVWVSGERIRALLNSPDSAQGNDTSGPRMGATAMANYFEERAVSAEARLKDLYGVIQAAGPHNLSNGVQLGPTVWFVKCSDAMASSEAHFAKYAGEQGSAKIEGAPILPFDTKNPSISVTPGMIQRILELSNPPRDDFDLAVNALIGDNTALQTRIKELERLLNQFLSCPEIADCAPEDKEPETHAAESAARALLYSSQEG